LQAQSLARLLLDRLDRDVGSDLGGGEAMSMQEPEGHSMALVLGALQVATNEF
jgi:hypothetical protein